MSSNTAIVESLYSALGAGDVPAVLGALDPEIQWNEAEHVTFWPGGAFVGPDAVVAGVFARIPETFGSTFGIEISRLLDCGSVVVMEGRYKGVSTATGVPLDAQVTHIWDIEDDKVVRFQQYTDTWQFAEATGEKPQTDQ